MKIHGLKNALLDYMSGNLCNPVILYYPEGGYAEACQDEDCHGDAFESLPEHYEIENISEYIKEDHIFGDWPSDEITEENLRAYIEWRFGEKVDVDEY